MLGLTLIHVGKKGLQFYTAAMKDENFSEMKIWKLIGMPYP